MEEMDHGNSLRSMTTIGNEKEQERVYDMIPSSACHGDVILWL
jgi:hypothetical protein